MDKYYKPIATLQLFHDFYAAKNLSACNIKPLPDTALFFKNHRMIFKKKGDAYIILQEASVEGGTPTIPFDNCRLFFGLSFNDPHYQLRSGLNYDPRFQKIVIRAGEEEEIRVSEKNILPLMNAPVQNGEEPLVITDEAGEIVFSSENDPPAYFRELEDGIYKAGEAAFLKCAQASEFEAVLILDLTEEETYKKITMPAGSYRWRYQVQKKYTQHEVLSLVDENENVKFEQAGSIKQDILVFISSEPVTLSDQVFTSLALYTSDILVKKFLPVPGLENVRFLSAEEKSLVLEAYVTV